MSIINIICAGAEQNTTDDSEYVSAPCSPQAEGGAPVQGTPPPTTEEADAAAPSPSNEERRIDGEGPSDVATTPPTSQDEAMDTQDLEAEGREGSVDDGQDERKTKENEEKSESTGDGESSCWGTFV